MGSRVVLRAVRGPLVGREFVFTETDTFLFGRNHDCHGCIPEADGFASRYHFLLETFPPSARLRDLGSLNGTLVNGTKTGGRAPNESARNAAARQYPSIELNDGDRIEVGETIFVMESTHAPAETRPRASSGAAYAPTAVKTNSAPLVIPGYVVQRELGRGGMGAVFLAHRVSDGRPVAIKTMLPNVPSDERSAEQFLREAALAMQLRHTNIVQTHELGMSDGLFFTVMDVCASSVENLLEQHGGRITWAMARPIILDALAGLDFAHRCSVEVTLADGSKRREVGVVHRDLKPANILLAHADGRQVAKLADFGLAKAFNAAGLSGHTATGLIGGTPAFMPREQLLDFKRVRPVSDVWAIGATLYNMLTGTTPYDFTGGRDPIAVILTSEATPIRKHTPTISLALAAVVDRAVQSDPARRFSTAAEMAEALAAVRA